MMSLTLTQSLSPPAYFAILDFDVLIGTDEENLRADNIPVDSRSKVVTDDGMVTIDA